MPRLTTLHCDQPPYCDACLPREVSARTGAAEARGRTWARRVLVRWHAPLAPVDWTGEEARRIALRYLADERDERVRAALVPVAIAAAEAEWRNPTCSEHELRRYRRR